MVCKMVWKLKLIYVYLLEVKTEILVLVFYRLFKNYALYGVKV